MLHPTPPDEPAQPGLVTVAVWVLYWGIVALGLRQPRIAERPA